MYIMLSVVMPGDPTLKEIYIRVEGIVKDLVAETWLVLVIDGKVTSGIDVVVVISPVKSAVVLTTLPDMPTAEDVEMAAKLMHFTVYVRLLLMRSFSGQKSSLLKPRVASTAAQSWLYSVDPVRE